jgi:hypothetical protein
VPEATRQWQVAEWILRSARSYGNPFADVAMDGIFTAPDGAQYVMPGFYDGKGTWRVRFAPRLAGRWTLQTSSRPHDAELCQEVAFDVAPSDSRGTLQATPGRAWGFHWESGEPAFLMGDTVYNLFGMAHCGLGVDDFLERRAQQGFNLLRVRLPVSPFHPPDGYSSWQHRRTWPWGGSEQSPQFDRFDLGYFRTVDWVVRKVEALGLGLEMIMEAWGFEYPFNARHRFTPEWEQLWMRYLIARYDAFNCVWFWTPMNEYEYYPDGDWRHNPVADRWAMRIARWIKATAPHGHIVSVHNGPTAPPFGQRFRQDPAAIDAIMLQTWGTTDANDGWLASGIEETAAAALEGWQGSALLAEWGYERNPRFQLRMPGHRYCDVDHTRRGAWRGVFSGMGIIHGFENSWGPWGVLDQDQPGVAQLLQVRRFLTEIVPFHSLRPAPELAPSSDTAEGEAALALASTSRDTVAFYLPTGRRARVPAELGSLHKARWFEPRTGSLELATPSAHGAYEPPDAGPPERPWDWVLLLER